MVTYQYTSSISGWLALRPSFHLFFPFLSFVIRANDSAGRNIPLKHFYISCVCGAHTYNMAVEQVQVNENTHRMYTYIYITYTIYTQVRHNVIELLNIVNVCIINPVSNLFPPSLYTLTNAKAVIENILKSIISCIFWYV